MNDEHLKKIADELGKLNYHFAQLIKLLSKANEKLKESPSTEIQIGSTGDFKQSEK